MKVLIVLSVFVARAFAFSDREYQNAFVSWMQMHQKSYNHDDFQYRYGVFRQNMDFVSNFNGSHKVALNKFADLTNAEFQRIYLGLKPKAQETSVQPQTLTTPTALPASWNWQTKGAVSHVKNQGQCGSCWAFSASEAIEGCHFITTGTLVTLSEQDLVDCSGSFGNQGCDGGLMDQAFQYVISAGGIDTESCYPYSAMDGNCHFNKAAPCCGSTVTKYTDVTSGSESALQQAVYTVPTAVGIDASQSSFQFYSGGVYYEPDCSSTQLDHGVLAVGWGTDSGSDYWIVKNSWGEDWGQQGYIWMARNKNNNCGIATAASYVTGCNNCK